VLATARAPLTSLDSARVSMQDMIPGRTHAGRVRMAAAGVYRSGPES
jgi:hypothetical protein